MAKRMYKPARTIAGELFKAVTRLERENARLFRENTRLTEWNAKLNDRLLRFQRPTKRMRERRRLQLGLQR